MIEQISSWIIGLIEHGSYAAVLLLMAAESACIPLPSEIIMPFAGYLASKGMLSIWIVALAGAVGCNVGSTLAYFVGDWGGRPFVERWGRFVLLSPDDIEKSERFFARFGPTAVFVARLLPVVRTFIALPAGFSKMPFLKFQAYTFAGSFIWCTALAYLGEFLGTQWDRSPAIQNAFHGADAIIVLIILMLLGWFVWSRLRQRRG